MTLDSSFWRNAENLERGIEAEKKCQEAQIGLAVKAFSIYLTEEGEAAKAFLDLGLDIFRDVRTLNTKIAEHTLQSNFLNGMIGLADLAQRESDSAIMYN